MYEVLPLAVGIALSPFPVIPAILLLFTERPRAAAWSFLLGWITGVAAVTGLLTLLAEVVDQPEAPPTWASWARIVLGAALVAYGVKQWLGRSAQAEQPAWLRSISTASPAQAFRLAVLLSAANPKVMLLAAAAGLVIGSDDFTAQGDVVAVVVFTLVASISVAIPVVGFTVLGERVLGPLGTARDWLERNNAAVMAVVLVVIGVLVLRNGIAGL